MKHLIDKTIVVAEIERIKKEECPIDTYEGRCKLLWFEQFLSFLNTLEVKEVEEEPVNKDLEEAAKNHAVERFRVTRDRELAEKCKWSFKTGAKWQKHLTDSLKVKDVDLEKEYEEFVVDDPILGNFITNDTMGMKLAKHFYELGLNAYKGE